MLHDEYNILMSEFKEAHKQYQKSMKENSQLRELRGDIDIIEMEKENGIHIVLLPIFFSSVQFQRHFILKLKINRLSWTWPLSNLLTCGFLRTIEEKKIPERYLCFFFCVLF